MEVATIFELEKPANASRKRGAGEDGPGRPSRKREAGKREATERSKPKREATKRQAGCLSYVKLTESMS